MATNPYGFTAEQALTTTDQMQIAQIAQYAPELRACIARNPNTYPALIEWLGQPATRQSTPLWLPVSEGRHHHGQTSLPSST